MSLSASDFELLLQANRILSSKLDDQEVLQAVMELATDVVHAEASSLLLLDPATNELFFDVAVGEVKDQVKQIRLKVGEGVAGWVARERQPLIVNDTSSDPRFTAKVDASTSFKTKSILAVPLIARGELVGVVEAINKENEGRFTTEDQEAFTLFANQAAIAIQNARLFSSIRRERAKLSSVFESMSEGVLIADAAGRALLANPACGVLLGTSGDKAVGKKIATELFEGFESHPKISDPISFRDTVTRVELRRKSGKDFIMSAMVSKLAAGGQEGWLIFLRDVTDERRETMLKQNFISLVSHKLKTPLTVILGYAPTLLSDNDNMTDFQKRAAGAVSAQGEHLNRLIDKLLRFTVVESDMPTKEPKAVAPAALVQEALRSIDTLREEKNAEINLDASVGRARDVLVDSSLAVEALRNVLENAIKFNDKPKKTVTISCAELTNAVRIVVADNGVGIPPEEQEKVFQKFYQVENHFTGQVPGAGLGLSLCKKVVETMGGVVLLTSQIGEGTQLSIDLPRVRKAE